MVYSYVYMTFSLLFNVELQAFSIFPTSSSTAFWACKTVLLCLASWRHRSQIPATFTWRVQTSLQFSWISQHFMVLYPTFWKTITAQIKHTRPLHEWGHADHPQPIFVAAVGSLRGDGRDARVPGGSLADELNVPSIDKAFPTNLRLTSLFWRFPIVFVTVCPLDPENSLAQVVQCFQTSCMEPWIMAQIRWFVGISAVIRWRNSGTTCSHLTDSALLFPLAQLSRTASTPLVLSFRLPLSCATNLGGQPSRKPWLYESPTSTSNYSASHVCLQRKTPVSIKTRRIGYWKWIFDFRRRAAFNLL